MNKNSVTKSIIISILMISLFLQSIFVSVDQVHASNSEILWQVMELDGVEYSIRLGTSGGQTVSGPLNEDEHGEFLDYFAVTNNETGQRVEDHELIARIVYLAQNKEIVLNSDPLTDNWNNYLYNSLYSNLYSNLSDYSGYDFDFWLPMMNEGVAQTIFLTHLYNHTTRVDVYKDVIKQVIFPVLQAEDIEKIENQFNRDLGDLLSDAKEQATEFPVGTVGFFTDVLDYLSGSAELVLKSLGYSTKFCRVFGAILGGANIAFIGWGVYNEIDELSSNSTLISAYIFSMGIERLSSLHRLVNNSNYVIDPAFQEAVNSLYEEFDSFDEPTWQELFVTWISTDPFGTALDILSVLASLAAIAALAVPLAPVVTVICVIIAGMQINYYLWEWLLTPYKLEAAAGVAFTAQYILLQELNNFYIDQETNSTDLNYCLILSNMRLNLHQMFFDLLVQNLEWFPDMFIPFLAGLDIDQLVAHFNEQANLRWDAFILTLPQVFWAYPQETWFDRLILHGENPVLWAGTVSPANVGSSNTPFEFSVLYLEYENTPPQFVNVKVNNTSYTMTSNDTTFLDGAMFESQTLNFPVGAYSFVFETKKQGSDNLVSYGPFSLTVNPPAASGVTLQASPPTLEMFELSTLTATVIDPYGIPISDEVVHFTSNAFSGAFLNCSTLANTAYATTNSSGIASICFRPNEYGIATLTATTSNGLSGVTQLTVTPSSNNTILITPMFHSGDATYSIYKVTAEPVDEDGNQIAFGGYQDFSSNSGLWSTSIGGPWNSSVSVWTNGDAYAFIKVESAGSIIVSVAYEDAAVYESQEFYFRVGPTPTITEPAFEFVGSVASAVDWYGDLIATMTEGNLSLWDASSWSNEPIRCISKIHGYYIDDTGDSIEFSPDGQSLASGETDYVYRLDTLTLTPAWSEALGDGLESHRELDWSPDGTKIIFGSFNSFNSTIINATNGNVISYTPTKTDKVWAVQYSPNGNYILESVQDDDGNFYVYNSSGSSLLCSGSTSDDDTGQVDAAWKFDSSQFAVGYEGGFVNIYNTYNCSLVQSLVIEGVNAAADVRNITWSPDGKYIAAKSHNDIIYIWDALNGNPIITIQAVINDYWADHLEWSPDSQMLAVAATSLKIYTPFDVTSPLASILSPLNGASVEESPITITGKATDNYFVRLATISVIGGVEQPITLDSNGLFSSTVDLLDGENIIKLTVTDGNGNISSDSITITKTIDQEPPMISNIQAAPESGLFCQIFTISASIVDPWSGVNPSTVFAKLQQPIDQDYLQLTLYDDGTNGDFIAGDDVYSRDWNSCSATIESTYYIDIYANDMLGNQAVLNNGASITIYDLPEITQINHSPVDLVDSQPITISATIVDQSGIGNSYIEYSLDDGLTYNAISMTYDSELGVYQGVMPKQRSGSFKYRVRAIDAFNHVSVSSEISSPIADTTPPAKITTLSAHPGEVIGQVIFTWISTGDDNFSGTSTLYLLRYSTNPIVDEDTWTNATEITGLPIPLVAGTQQNFVASGLEPDALLYFAIRAMDEVPNTSLISPYVSAIVPGPITGLTAENDSPVLEGMVVNLSATITSGRNVTYTWDLGDGSTADGQNIDHTYSSSGTYLATVTAMNSAVTTSASTIVIIINQAPIANAGDDQSVDTLSDVILNGSGSDPDGDLPFTYQWTQTEGPTVTLSDDTASSPVFTAPVDPALLKFELTITDSLGLVSSPDEVIIAINNQAPVANAGDDQVIDTLSVVTLDGTNCFDPDTDLPLTYLWTQTSGPIVNLDDPTLVSPRFTATGSPNIFRFSLVVTDCLGLVSNLDEVAITSQGYHIFIPLMVK